MRPDNSIKNRVVPRIRPTRGYLEYIPSTATGTLPSTTHLSKTEMGPRLTETTSTPRRDKPKGSVELDGKEGGKDKIGVDYYRPLLGQGLDRSLD